jgi:phosphoribosylaminoimidazole carboxylase (NCAIR synthetase)
MIDLDFEASVVVSKDVNGNITSLEPVFNIHKDDILQSSIALTDEHIDSLIPSETAKKLKQQAEDLITNWEDYT